MVDYYEELKINQKLGLDEINKELSQVENTWRRREINNPEKAAKMISLIMDARKVFRTDASRAEYDYQLTESRKTSESSESDEKRKLILGKWKAQALSYYNDHEYDLAKVAVEKALSQIDLDGDDDALFALAAEIYMENGNNSPALDYIDKAIVFAPDISSYYITKGLIYDQLKSESQRYSDYAKAQDCLHRAREMYRRAISKAEDSGDQISKARALGALAFSLYFQDCSDKEEAGRLALEAERVGGDSWGNAKRVLDDIAAIENARKDAIYSEAIKLAVSCEISEIEKAVAKLETIIDHKDSMQQIKKLTDKIHSIREAEEKKRLEEQECRFALENAYKEERYSEAMKLVESKKIPEIEGAISKLETIANYKDSAQQIQKLQTKLQLLYHKEVIRRKRIIKAMSVVTMIIVILGFRLYNIQRHKCGDNLTWSYDRKTNTLTITGTGSMKDFASYETKPWKGYSDKIETVIVEEGATTIGSHAFNDCDKLVSVSFPDSLLRIESFAFSSANNLSKIDLPNNLEFIGESAFAWTNITEVYIPASVTEIERAFDDTKLACFTVAPENNCFISVDGVLFSKDMSILWLYPCLKSDKFYEVPKEVKEIHNWQFSDWSIPIEEIYIPHSVISITLDGVGTYYGPDLVVHYSGTKEEWHSLANEIDFNGRVYCLDGSYIYQHAS